MAKVTSGGETFDRVMVEGLVAGVTYDEIIVREPGGVLTQVRYLLEAEVVLTIDVTSLPDDETSFKRTVA
jgi:hypothetical protein